MHLQAHFCEINADVCIVLWDTHTTARNYESLAASPPSVHATEMIGFAFVRHEGDTDIIYSSLHRKSNRIRNIAHCVLLYLENNALIVHAY